jgi:hypothetical protein
MTAVNIPGLNINSELCASINFGWCVQTARRLANQFVILGSFNGTS